MKLHSVKQLLKYLPTPVFLAGFIWSIVSPPLICGHDLSMPLMWLLMSLAHLPPYIQLWEDYNSL
jgi:hypothetical protein